MAISSGFDCADVFSKFTSEGKFASASKNFIENRNNYYKLTKHISEYGFAIAEVASIVPTDFIPIFQAIRSIVSVVFEAWGMVHKVNEIKSLKEQLAISGTKIEKWNDPSRQFNDEAPLDRERLERIRIKYIQKLTDLDEKEEKEKFDRFRKERWEEYVQLIESSLTDGDPVAIQALQAKFSARRDRKISDWKKEHEDTQKRIQKAYFSIAISVGTIALEVITLVGIAFSAVDGGLTYTAIRIGSGLIVSGMKYGKYLWWNISKGEKPGIIAIKSVEHIGCAIAKTKLLPFSDIVHPSLIKGACKTTISSIGVFNSHYNFMDTNYAIRNCRKEINRLERRKVTVLLDASKIASGNRRTMHEKITRYSEKIQGTHYVIEQYRESLETQDLDEKEIESRRTQISLFEINIKRWRSYLDVLQRAYESNSIRDAKAAAERLTESTLRELSNNKLSEQVLKKNNLKETMKIALSIVEIARFAFLVTAVSFAIVGFGVNLLPFLFVSSIFANLLYAGYFWFNTRTNKEIDDIVDIWSRDEVVAAN